MFDFLLSAAAAEGEPSRPVMVLVIILCLTLPFIIKKITGKGIYEWLSSLTLLGRLEKKEAEKKLREKEGPRKKYGISQVSSKNDTRKTAQNSRTSGQTMQEDAQAQKHRARMLQNDWMRFLKRLLDFARKNQLFVLIPGDLVFENSTVQQTAVMVTKSRVIGVQSFVSGPDVKILDSGDVLMTKADGTKEQIPDPLKDADAAQETMVKILAQLGLDSAPCETMVVFTGQEASFGGNKSGRILNQEQFFARISSEPDLHTGGLDPKKAGKLLSTFRPGKNKK